VDVPYVETEEKGYSYSTIPMGIIMVDDVIITVTSRESTLINDFTEERVRGFWTFKRTRFILQMLNRNANRFLGYLKQIDKASTFVQKRLQESLRNRELFQMMQLEKSLVYFSTSLKGNEIVLEKMMRMDLLRKYPEDAELLEDVIIENKQAIEMCNIYRDIMSGTMDAYASIISNNLNIVMKVLTSLTVLLAVPTLFASLWGMNTGVPFQGNILGFWIVLGVSTVITVIVFFLLRWRKMF
jgi:magnesium transporter